MDVNERLEALEARIAELERQRWGPPRLGPKPPSSDEMAERLVQAVKDAIPPDAMRPPAPPPVDRSKVCTTSGEPAAKVRAEQTEETGQHKAYIVLCEDERQKGFVRPYRDSYRHVGPKICGLHVGPDGATVCHMDPKHEGECGVAKGPRPQVCGATTTMGRALSETYARDPGFYGATFCVMCNAHFPVNEFVWTHDGATVGS